MEKCSELQQETAAATLQSLALCSAIAQAKSCSSLPTGLTALIRAAVNLKGGPVCPAGHFLKEITPDARF